MKKSIILTMVAFFTFSFMGISQEKNIDTARSEIMWKGQKITGVHEGTLHFKEGVLNFQDGKLIGGNFVVNMSTINTTDLSGKQQQNLNAHLKADDFFGVDKYPEAILTFDKVNPSAENKYAVSGNITIKGITKPVNFDISVDKNKATTSLTIDRTKFGIKYGSGSFFDNLGDKAIYDDFEIKVDLQF